MAVDYGEDWLQRIVGVHWRAGSVKGAVFVYGMNYGNQLGYVHFKNNADDNPDMQTVVLPEPPAVPPGPDPTPAFVVVGSSYAHIGTKPVFLICGYREIPHVIDDGIGNEVLVDDYHALIYASNDGLSWSRVHSTDAIRNDFSIDYVLINIALVWKPSANQFYYDENYEILHIHTGAFSHQENIFSSSDGVSWGAFSSTEVGADYISPFPSYCVHNNCVDESGQHVPDGVICQNATDKIVVRPVDPGLWDYASGNRVTGNSGSVEIVDSAAGITLTKSMPGIAIVTCAAGAGGVLMAGGYTADSSSGAIAYSLDGGKTWRPLTTTPQPVTTMIASSG
jgi:hypothetical protein